MKKTSLKIPWLLTGIVAMLLLIATIALTAKMVSSASSGYTAYLASPTQLIYLHEEPSAYSKSIAIKEHGTAVTVLRTHREGNQNWYFIDADETSGWVSESRIRSTPP
jgi:SH3-like domain-containing protein